MYKKENVQVFDVTVYHMVMLDKDAQNDLVQVPIRISERIRWIREIRNWQEIPELVEIEDAHVHVSLRFAEEICQDLEGKT